MVSRRGRGRPPGDSDARDRIAAAAMHEFGDHGYDGATMRAIAARAEVDAALVHHYFGTKADLFAEVAGFPVRPDIEVPAILRGRPDDAGERIVRFVLEAFEHPEVRKRGVMVLRTAVGGTLAAPLVSGFLSRELLPRIAGELDAADAELRAGLVVSQIAGLLMTRHVVKLWSSKPMQTGVPEWVELEWDVPAHLDRIDLLFNDDVDEDIVNLHRHSTPFPVIPEVVRHYRLEIRTCAGWLLVAEETENRWRHRRHVVSSAVRALGLRLTVEATHGSPHAMVHAIRALTADTPAQ